MSYQNFLQLFDLAHQIHIPHQQIVMAACACARTTLQYIPRSEDRPRIAIETTEKWCRGEATLEEVEQARDNAWQYRDYDHNDVADDHAAAVRAAHAALAAADDHNDVAAVAHNTAYAHAHAAAQHPYGSKEYKEALQQAEQEMCQLILQHIPRLKNLMVMI